MGKPAPAAEPAVEEATGKIESKSEAKKDFVPTKGLTTAGEGAFGAPGRAVCPR